MIIYVVVTEPYLERTMLEFKGCSTILQMRWLVIIIILQVYCRYCPIRGNVPGRVPGTPVCEYTVTFVTGESLGDSHLLYVVVTRPYLKRTMLAF